MNKIIVGKVTLTLQGNYDSTKKYTRLDVVSYQGSSYICRADTSDTPPSNNWQLLGSKGDPGKDGSTLDAKLYATQEQLTKVQQIADEAQQAVSSLQKSRSTVDASSPSTSKKPSEYADGIVFNEIKTAEALSLDRSGMASEVQQGTTAFVTTVRYGQVATQKAVFMDGQEATAFVRNGTGDSWSKWYYRQLTTM